MPKPPKPPDRIVLELVLIRAEAYAIAILQAALWPDRTQVEETALRLARKQLLDVLEEIDGP